MGVVYLCHFSRPYKHARHYLGYSDNLDTRVLRHRNGNGARLLQVIKANGIEFDIVRTWEGDRTLERRLKRWKKNSQLCPICNKRGKQ